MSTYIVCYDLHVQGQNYSCIIRKLESYPIHWHTQQSVWIIETHQTAVQIRDNLSGCLDKNDKLLVAELSRRAAWIGYSDNISKWLKDRLNARV